MKKTKQIELLKKITIIFGYSLFGLLLVAVTASTIVPFSAILLHPGVRHLNVAVTLVSLVAGAILPPLLSYLIGDKATHSKSKLDHHFNGVLFGIASYWLSTFFYYIGADIISTIRAQLSEPAATVVAGWPILATLVLLVAVAIGYVKNQKTHSSLLDYKPYQIVLFVGVVAQSVYVLANQNFVENTLWIVSLLYVVVPLILIAISYRLLPARYYSSSAARLAGGVVAVSLGFTASSTAGQLLMYPGVSAAVPLIVGAAVLALYLAFIRRLK